MKKYVFLTGHYLPKPGATGMCVHQLAKEMARRGHNVATICYEDGDRTEEYDGVKIIKIVPPSFLKENMSASTIERKANHLRSLISKLIHIRSYPLRSIALVKRYIAEIEKLLTDAEHVVITASVNPLEAVIAADKIKRKYPGKVMTVYYCADTLSNEKGDDGILPAEYRTKCGIRWEKKLFESFDRVMIMECHKEHYFSSEFAEFTNKMELVNFPLFTRLEVEEKKKTDATVELTYAGTLYRKLRNPQYLCNLLIELSKGMKIHASFLGSGDCDDIIVAAAEESNGCIEKMGMQPHDVAMQYIGNADVLLSIGNVDSPMAPSKIYEYMSTGKPIIHVYTYEKDPCLDPLRIYGNALLIKENDSSGCEKMTKFIDNRKILGFEEVQRKFLLSTPAYSIDLIENL